MALAEVTNFKKPITAICSAGTLVYYAYGDGNIYSYTIADATLTLVCKVTGKVTAMATDNTYLYIAIDNKILRYTIANATQVITGQFRAGIMSMALYSSVLYIGLVDGAFCTGP